MAEDHKERVDRELIELLNEIRVVLPGAQVLFAFLLSLPFTQRFESLTAADRDAYFAAFLCTAIGTSMLMAPSMNHRLRFREHDKERMLLWFNKLILGGSGLPRRGDRAVRVRRDRACCSRRPGRRVRRRADRRVAGGRLVRAAAGAAAQPAARLTRSPGSGRPAGPPGGVSPRSVTGMRTSSRREPSSMD